jgi:hypothetical protein
MLYQSEGQVAAAGGGVGGSATEWQEEGDGQGEEAGNGVVSSPSNELEQQEALEVARQGLEGMHVAEAPVSRWVWSTS